MRERLVHGIDHLLHQDPLPLRNLLVLGMQLPGVLEAFDGPGEMIVLHILLDFFEEFLSALLSIGGLLLELARLGIARAGPFENLLRSPQAAGGQPLLRGINAASAALLVSALLVVARRDVLWSAFCVGLLMSMATITRMNVAFVVVALGAYYAWGFVWPRPRLHRFAIVAYGAGGLVPLLTLLAAYWSAGALDVLYLATVSVPLSYSQDQMTVLGVLAEHARLWIGFSVYYPGIFIPLTILILVG
ncbi:MAG: hypothetical protein IH895_09725, partial [Planctomycetes bacterium]|nr:hypothetical protein [Planctomycetota bacterium]